MTVSERARAMMDGIEQVEIDQKSLVKTKKRLEADVARLIAENKIKSEDLDIAVNAITILRDVSDEAVRQSYEFIQDSLNAALAKIFQHTTRRIKLKETTFRGQYPQLEIELTVENGKVRSLKSGSGHGLMQIVSLLCVLALIVITNSRKLLVIDEVLSGLSANARKIINDILWTFTTIGFQFVISEHGFVPQNSNVYFIEMKEGISSIKANYIEKKGVYLDGTLLKVEEEEEEEY